MSISDRYEFKKRILAEEMRCFYPDAPNGCSLDGPIKSHSISKGISLAAIAENGRVTSIAKPFNDIVFEENAEIQPSGINISSIFPGFCQKHDNELFSAIETDGWDANKFACFLLSYRSFCYTILASRIKIRYFESMNTINLERWRIIEQEGFSDDDIGNDYDFEVFVRKFFSYVGGSGKNMHIDDNLRSLFRRHAELRAQLTEVNPYLTMAKDLIEGSKFDKMREMFVAKDFSTFRYISYRYSCILPFATSKTIRVRVQSEQEFLESHLSVNVCSNGKESFIVFGWLEDGGIVESYLNDFLISDEMQIINRLLDYLFKNPKNTFFQTSWWNSLSDQTRHNIISYHSDVLNALPDQIQSSKKYFEFIPEFGPVTHRRG